MTGSFRQDLVDLRPPTRADLSQEKAGTSRLMRRLTVLSRRWLTALTIAKLASSLVSYHRLCIFEEAVLLTMQAQNSCICLSLCRNP
jgi:hypothetical protein